MKREFLKGLGLEDEVIDKIMTENGADLEREKAKAVQAKADVTDLQQKLSEREQELQKLKTTVSEAEANKRQLDELQAKYETETEQYKAQLAEREYSEAISRAISGKELKFSSKSAQRAFEAAIREQKLELKDGELADFDGFIKTQLEADPDAFVQGGKLKMSSGAPLGGTVENEPTSLRAALQEKYEKKG